MTKSLSLVVDVQNALEAAMADGAEDEKPPSASQLKQWAERAHQAVGDKNSEVTLRLVDDAEMAALNQGFRGKVGVTNVLSFPVDDEFDLLFEGDESSLGGAHLLGDVVICHSVIVLEAIAQNKPLNNHYAHMVTHGVLHLHGFDHLDDESAEVMEALEATILSVSGIENPYN